MSLRSEENPLERTQRGWRSAALIGAYAAAFATVATAGSITTGAAPLPASAADAQAPAVVTDTGAVRGKVTAGVERFLGIRTRHRRRPAALQAAGSGRGSKQGCAAAPQSSMNSTL